MEGTRASDEVIDEIALIAMLRHDAERHGGVGGGSASSEALRKLHELRDREQKAMQTAEDKSVHLANLDAVANEIRKVQHSGGGNRTNSGGGGGGERHARPRPQQQQQPRKEGGGGAGPGGGGPGGGGGNPHNQSRNKGRRNQGGRQGRP